MSKKRDELVSRIAALEQEVARLNECGQGLANLLYMYMEFVSEVVPGKDGFGLLPPEDDHRFGLHGRDDLAQLFAVGQHQRREMSGERSH